MGSKSAIGIGNGICFKQVRDKGGGSYIDPLVRDSLVGVWKADQNTNESPTRNIIKNTIKNKGGDLELLNFAYKANSGYSGYPEDFTSWRNSSHLQVEYSTDGSKFKITSENIKDWWLIVPNSGISNSFKVKITNCHFPIVWRYTDDGNTYKDITISEDGIYNLPQSIINNEGVVNSCCFGSGTQRNDYTGLTIEQFPLYEGALVTDGKDDMIVSQKTVQEMGITDEITVVSMIHQIGGYNSGTSYTNYIKYLNEGYIRNNVLLNGVGKTGIYGYTWNGSVQALINNILGDKSDYSYQNNLVNLQSKFSVEGYINNGSSTECSEVAVYWTFIANKVLTTDEINQIIAYFKLDKYVTPQVIYDVKRQGLTNDTPAADWYLKDFSGNGHDMQLYNYAKSKDSGIGKYVENFLDKTKWGLANGVSATKDTLKVTDKFNPRVDWIVFADSGTLNDINLEVSGIPEGGTFILSINANAKRVDLHNGFNSLKLDAIAVTTTTGYRILYGQDLDWSKLIITQILDYEGALVSDGKDDYGHADNLPIFKDYTVAIDRAWINLVGARAGCLSTKNSDPDWGAFNFELSESTSRNTFSFGNATQVSIDVDRKISYQSKYSYNGAAIIGAGNIVDGKDLFLFRSRSTFPYYEEAAVWSYLLFPYSLSEFLLERQLKKYKLGTLYPDMVEFRPVISENIPYNAIEISQGPTTLYNKVINKTGIYLREGSTVRVYIRPSGIDEVSKITVNGVEYTDLPINPNGYYYADFPITKIPQKIDITIDEYIRFEDIVQPYPEIWTITQNGNKVSWGDKLKVGSEFGYNSKVNLLSDVYTTTNSYYNGKVVKEGNILKVEKQMTFACDKTWKLNTTEPHAIYSPQKLNIPNSSLKILGYVPDLTGKGNHGKLNNFAYAGMSGANGYPNNFNSYTVVSGVTKTDSSIKVEKELTGSGWFLAIPANTSVVSMKLNITGIPSNKTIKWATNVEGIGDIILVNGINEIPAYTSASVSGIYAIFSDLQGLKIEQIGEHEGSICFDGTDDHITIPTLAHGGKCVMMKVNTLAIPNVLYDQRINSNTPYFAIYNEQSNDYLAYNSRNENGNTYIDGILNKNIYCSQLAGITHNITITNEGVTDSNSQSPTIGSVHLHTGNFAKMAMYEFMLFPKIPSEDEIKKLNDVKS